MPFRPRIFQEDPDPDSRDPRRPTTSPLPIIRRELIQETPSGTKVDVVMQWYNEDAAECHRCDACSFVPGPGGQGFCITREKASLRILGLAPTGLASDLGHA